MIRPTFAACLIVAFLTSLPPAIAQTTKPKSASAPTGPVVNPLRPARPLKTLQSAPLYTFNEKDVERYLGWLEEHEKDPIQRVIHLARKNIGQPYEIFLLGEGPFETYDPDPMYCLQQSDCVTFVEHTFAMALSRDWAGFFKTLQRLRYKDGKVGMLTRNHESVADWDPNNAWLFEEITGRAQEMSAIMNRLHGTPVQWSSFRILSPSGTGAGAGAGGGSEGPGIITVVCNEETGECGCYDHEAGTCGPCPELPPGFP